MPDEEQTTERPSFRRAAAPVEPPPKRYRVLKTIVVRDKKYRVGDIIDEKSAHEKLNWKFCLKEKALEEVK